MTDIGNTNIVMAVLAGFALTAAFTRLLLPALTRFKFGQQVREDGPRHHLAKQGTPTIGGVAIIAGFAAAALLFGGGGRDAVAVALATLGFGAVGFLDDFIKIRKKRSLGLRAYQKIIGQLAVSAGFLLYWRGPGIVMVPFTGMEIHMGGGIPYAALACLVFISSANGANLTDGLDGLASGVTAIVAAFFLAAAAVVGCPGVSPAVAAMLGALLGFLLFNSHPARVYMGDTGSLALGGFVAAAALVLGLPLFLPIVAAIYVVESLSVIIQVGYFKLTKGKRFFKMAPIHHSFELSGWPETKIVALFTIATAIAAFVALAGLAANW